MKKLIFAIIIYGTTLFAEDINKFENSYITITSPKEMINFIKNNQQQQPLFIFLSSEDGECKHCEHFNKTIDKVADKRAGDIDFVYVSFPRYKDINNYPEIIKKFHILGMPTSLIVYKDKVLDTTFGNTKQKRIETTIDAALQKINGGVESIIDKNIQYYLDANSYKAIYVAIDNPNSYVYSTSIGQTSPLDALFKASKKCIKERMRKSLVDRCKLYMLEDEVVYEKDEKQIREIIKSLSPTEEITR